MNDGRSLISIFIWSASAEYEKGDFVVKNDCIYKCTAGNPTNKESFTVMGRDPETDKENFKIYPGDHISTAEEYFEYAEKVRNGEEDIAEDKFISMHTLYDILQRLYFGVSTNGIVDNYVLKTESGINYLVNGVTDLDKASEPIDIILTAPNLNNGILKVSRDFFEGLFITDPEQLSTAKNYYSSDLVDNTVIILRQYTYDYSPTSSAKVRRRTQEIIDPVYGDMFVRYADGSFSEDGKEVTYSIVSSWKPVSLGSGELKTTLTSLYNSYQDMYDNYIKSLANEGSTFKTIYPLSALMDVPGYYPLPNVWIADQSGTGDDTNLGSCLYTVVVSSKLRTGLYRNYSVTIEALEVNEQSKAYYLSDSTYLDVSKVLPNEQNAELGILFSVVDNNDVLGSEITNIYYKRDNEQ